jgi:hypothetical protein
MTTMTRDIGSWRSPAEAREAEQGQWQEFPRPEYHQGIGWAWKLAGLAGVAIIVGVGLSLLPDIQRYLRIRNM